MTGTLLFLGLGMQEILFIALIVLFILWWEEDTRTDEGGWAKGVKSF